METDTGKVPENIEVIEESHSQTETGEKENLSENIQVDNIEVVEEGEEWKKQKLSYFVRLGLNSIKDVAISIAVRVGRLDKDEPCIPYIRTTNVLELYNMELVEQAAIDIMSQKSADPIVRQEKSKVVRPFLIAFASGGITGLISVIKNPEPTEVPPQTNSPTLESQINQKEVAEIQ
jgi:hypothetical protein